MEVVEGEAGWHTVMREEMGSCSMLVGRRWVGTGELLAGKRQGCMAGNLHCIYSDRCMRVAGRSAPDLGHRAGDCRRFVGLNLLWVSLDDDNPQGLGLRSMPELEPVDSTTP